MRDMVTTRVQNEQEIRDNVKPRSKAERLIQDWRRHAGRLAGCGCKTGAAVNLYDPLTGQHVGFCQRHAEGDRFGREGLMRQDWEVDGEGWKFLDPTGATHHEGEAFVYALPGPDQEWGPWTVHPDPVEPDGEDCGKGRLHVMNGLNAVYAPSAWWPWRAQYSGVIGESPEKVGAIAIRLKRVSKYDFWQMLRGGEGQGAYLRRANLEVANLKGANLKGANLWRANLWRANLWGASLKGADLRGADLRGVNLREADLREANLWEASLEGADLWGADLKGADLREANLLGVNLREADLRGANLEGANLEGANLWRANLRGANLEGADLAKSIGV